jgi:ribosomal protein S18 acetylase RimI-like enzyme
LRLRKADSRDECFLQQLFRSNRPHLTQIPMPVEFVDALVQQQYEFQRGSYDREFPDCLNLVILLRQESIGNLKLHQDAQAGCLRLLDIALHPEHRGRGHGGTLLRSLQTLAAHKDWVLRLSVDHQNWRAKNCTERWIFGLKKPLRHMREWFGLQRFTQQINFTVVFMKIARKCYGRSFYG